MIFSHQSCCKSGTRDYHHKFESTLAVSVKKGEVLFKADTSALWLNKVILYKVFSQFSHSLEKEVLLEIETVNRWTFQIFDRSERTSQKPLLCLIKVTLKIEEMFQYCHPELLNWLIIGVQRDSPSRTILNNSNLLFILYNHFLDFHQILFQSL
jgi:hypothetical protein